MQLKIVEKLLQTLKDIGLTANEATVYLTLINIGANAASTIAKQSNLNRSTCYTILEKLLSKGFIQENVNNKISYYVAVEPKYILGQLKNKQQDLEGKIQNLNGILAQFELIKNVCNGKPRVVFFEGEAGIQNIMEDTLTSKEQIRAYASLSELIGLLPNYFTDYYQRRAQKGISIKAIYPADEISYYRKKRDPYELRESRLIPKEFDFHLDILIYENKVAITSLKAKFGVLIENKEMAEAQKKIFDLIWEGTKKYDDAMTRVLKMQLETAEGEDQRSSLLK